MKHLARHIQGRLHISKPRWRNGSGEKDGCVTSPRPVITVLPIESDDDEENFGYDNSDNDTHVDNSTSRRSSIVSSDSNVYSSINERYANDYHSDTECLDAPNSEASAAAAAAAAAEMHLRALAPPDDEYSRTEWENKAASGMFGSFRPRKSKAVEQKKVAYSNSISSTLSGGGKQPEVYTSAWLHELKRSLGKQLDLSEPGRDICVNALNELLFMANSWVDNQLKKLISKYNKGRVVSKFPLDFEFIVETAYTEFIDAAESIMAIISEMESRPSVSSDRSSQTFVESMASQDDTSPRPSVDSMENIVFDIINSYADRATANKNTRKGSARRNARLAWDSVVQDTSSCQVKSLEHSSGAASASPRDFEYTLEKYGVDTVKYSKEQLRLYATASVRKIVTSQMLLSTGLENELIDRLEEESDTLATVRSSIDSIEAREDHVTDKKRDLLMMRLKAAQLSHAIAKTEGEVKQASLKRRVYETLFGQISSM
ncbi:hypothetical protein GGI12_001033 [Dipsacomyces acuminosporus]|nr:hypothetical protein GGI12_001033 [Dipsacomyces acuminosporus]